jgi:3-oxoacyl-[acyl-carrier-protein] synthase II
LSHARQRDATVYAIAAGAGYSSDAYHIAHPAPDGAGVASAISRALADAQVGPAQVVHVNAHATSTPEGDALEAQALVKALGSATDGVVVTSTKSMTGHLLGGAGAIESVAAVLALHNHVAPPTINLDDLDEDVPVDVATEPRPLAKRGSEPMAVLNNALGFGGHNVSLVFTAA